MAIFHLSYVFCIICQVDGASCGHSTSFVYLCAHLETSNVWQSVKKFPLEKRKFKSEKTTPLKHKMKIKLGRQWRRLFTRCCFIRNANIPFKIGQIVEICKRINLRFFMSWWDKTYEKCSRPFFPEVVFFLTSSLSLSPSCILTRTLTNSNTHTKNNNFAQNFN